MSPIHSCCFLLLALDVLAEPATRLAPATQQPAIPSFFYLAPPDGGTPAFIGAGSQIRARFEAQRILLRNGQQQATLEFLETITHAAPRGRQSRGQASTAHVNFFNGSQPAQWRTGLPLFNSVEYRELYPGIDLAYTYEGARLKSEFLVAPGADPRAIHWRYPSSGTHILPNGTLVVTTPTGELQEAPPVLFQYRGVAKTRVPGQFERHSDGSVGFSIGQYDKTLPLNIDPVVTFSTFWGGSMFDALTSVAIGSDGSIYAAGWTESYDVPTANTFQSTNRYPTDAFVLKLTPAGDRLIYATYIGGSGSDSAQGIAVDTSGSAYITGYSSSTDFPTWNPLRGTNAGGRDAFVTKFSTDGKSLVYSTYLGGNASDTGNAIAVDSSGDAFVTGNTSSTNFPTVSPFQSSNAGIQDGFVSKLNPAGSALLFSTYLGGSGNEQATSIAINNGQVFVAGSTDSTNFPTLNAYQTSNHGGQDAFVTKINSTGATLAYSTYLGGSSGVAGLPESANAIVVDTAGNAYIAGTTSSLDFPVINAAQGSFAGGTNDAFVAKLNSTGNALVFSTYLGGTSYDMANAIALDSSGQIYVAGGTTSSSFPLVLPMQSAIHGQYDAFITTLSTTGSQIVFSTFWGGTASDSVLGMACAQNTLAIVGLTQSSDFPLSAPVQSTNPGNYGGFISAFNISTKGIAKVGIFRSGLWVVDGNANGIWDGSPPDKIISLGQSGDVAVTGDWNGDGHLKAGVFRGGLWILDYNGNGSWDGPPTDRVCSLGQSGDIPVVGDWNGDGHAKIGIFRAGLWVLDYNGNCSWDGQPPDRIVNLGQAGDVPIVGDWNGTGFSKVGVYRNGLWVLDYNGNGLWDGTPTDEVGSLGQAGDIPIIGDWNGDGRSKIGIFRGGLWLLDWNGNGTWDGAPTDHLYSLGLSSDTPVVGDWNGDKRTKIGVFRSGVWYLDFDGDGSWRTDKGEITISIGQSGDIPTVGPW